jgi:restriction system protein
MALREDKKARFERIPGKVTGLFKKTQWPDTYEFSVGKYTPSGNVARVYAHRIVTAEDVNSAAPLQKLQPVLAMTGDGTQWWWYLDRFWRDDEGLSPDDVQALVDEKDRRRQASLDRARAGDEGRERATEVRNLNEHIEETIAALETLLVATLDGDVLADASPEGSDPETVASYFSDVLDKSSYPEGFPRAHRVAFVPESRQLVVELELPAVSIVPSVKAYRYVKSRDVIEETARPQSQIRALYGQVVAQTALRTLHELFQADRTAVVETLVLNCYVDTIDPATGQPARPHLVTVRTSKEAFQKLNLRQVDALACLKGLRAVVSRSPHELVPVRPILEFDMVDPRFIQESDVLGTLDERPNLMELTPQQFEALISNLFEKMGLDTRQTQASRDGGVDCVAWDQRPIFGGKVIIQAKRYKNTVGVSAVRDLFGTMQNEGASKGILITTSGYGKSSFEFADGKPLELLDGRNLLYLLSEHADIDARIEVPEDWVDPIPDVATDEPQASPPATA